jgi:hypothetical protein
MAREMMACRSIVDLVDLGACEPVLNNKIGKQIPRESCLHEEKDIY